MNNLEQKIKELIINCLDLEDITPEDIITEEPLFGEGLGLDSIDGDVGAGDCAIAAGR